LEKFKSVREDFEKEDRKEKHKREGLKKWEEKNNPTGSSIEAGGNIQVASAVISTLDENKDLILPALSETLSSVNREILLASAVTSMEDEFVNTHMAKATSELSGTLDTLYVVSGLKVFCDIYVGVL
jgi:hypothetical protein